MIIWLNGAFGAGKTTVAAELREIVPDSRIFDPETVGYLLQDNLADIDVSDFQQWPPWRPLVVAVADAITRFTGQHLIAPQTVLTRAYMEEILAGFTAARLDAFHVLLDADEAVLRRRIAASDEAREWRADHVAEYRASRAWMVSVADLVVDTGQLTPAEAAQLIARSLPPAAGITDVPPPSSLTIGSEGGRLSPCRTTDER